MGTKGYDIWRYERTTELEQKSFFIRRSDVHFSDGYNTLTCEAVGLGPFWFTQAVWQTLVGCLSGGQNDDCSQDYFGVYP